MTMEFGIAYQHWIMEIIVRVMTSIFIHIDRCKQTPRQILMFRSSAQYTLERAEKLAANQVKAGTRAGAWKLFLWWMVRDGAHGDL